MADERALRQDLRRVFDAARTIVREFTGLYRDEDLSRAVLRLCDQAGTSPAADPRLAEARALVDARCRRLAQVSDRFGERDPALIAEARTRAIAAVDTFQDVVLDVCRPAGPRFRDGVLLRRRGR